METIRACGGSRRCGRGGVRRRVGDRSAASPSSVERGPNQGTTSVQATCDPNGTSTLTFTESGTASGSYPGSYTVSGTVTLGTQDNTTINFLNPQFGALPVGSVLTAHVDYQINSTVGQVQGTADLNVPAPVSNNDVGVCSALLPPSPFGDQICANSIPSHFGLFASFPLDQAIVNDNTYSATITTSAGLFSDHGIYSYSAFTRCSSATTDCCSAPTSRRASVSSTRRPASGSSR